MVSEFTCLPAEELLLMHHFLDSCAFKIIGIKLFF